MQISIPQLSNSEVEKYCPLLKGVACVYEVILIHSKTVAETPNHKDHTHEKLMPKQAYQLLLDEK